MDKTIYLYRHGETEYNRRGVVQGGGVDSSLNAKGKRQAQAFFETYRHVGFCVLLTSALRRTHETIAPFLQLGIPWEQHPDINEINWGKHEGKPSTPAMKKQYKTVIEEWSAGRYHARLEAGESAEELTARCRRFVEHLRAREEERILICSHGRAMRCLVCCLKEQPPSAMNQYHHANTGLYRLQQKDGVFLFKIENDTSHLNGLARNKK